MTKTEKQALRRQPGETYEAWMARLLLARAQREIKYAAQALQDAEQASLEAIQKTLRA